jgi:hypothetical protein
MSAEQSQAWLAPQLMGSVQAALITPWILDIDTTIKPLFGMGIPDDRDRSFRRIVNDDSGLS